MKTVLHMYPKDSVRRVKCMCISSALQYRI